MVQPQRRTESVTIRSNVGYNNKTFAFLYVFLGFLNFLFVNDFCNHILSLFTVTKVLLFYVLCSKKTFNKQIKQYK